MSDEKQIDETAGLQHMVHEDGRETHCNPSPDSVAELEKHGWKKAEDAAAVKKAAATKK